MTKCYLCGVTKTFKHLDRFVCNRCFVRLIEKRVKKGLSRVFSKDEAVLVIGDLAEYFFDLIMKDFPIRKIKRKKIPVDVSKFDRVVIEETMDDVDAEFLSGFFSAGFKIKKDGKIIKILQSITDEEAVWFAKIKKINFKLSDKNKTIKEFLKKISVKHPEVRFNLLKNVKEMEKIIPI